MEDIKVWLVKILLPSLVAISIKLAIQSKKRAVTWFSATTSFIAGIGSAYLSTPLVMSSVANEYIPIAIAIIAISGEKIGFWLVYKMNVQSIMEGLLEKFIKKK